jgi:N-hydroxyarylamine O-acetyltransferase
MLDVPAYLERVGRREPRRATFDALAGLLRAHVERIPFENLDVLLGRGVRLDLDSLQDKLVRQRRGGYCFEHATLFAAALEALGFQVQRHSARVVIAAPRMLAPRSHMFLTVALPEGRFVVDPGFGGHTSRTPVPLVPGERVRLDDEEHWMARDGDHWVLRTRTPEREMDLWASTLEHDNPVDFEVSNHYIASHPASGFVNRLMLRAFTPDGRVHVMNREVTEWRGGTAHRRGLANRAELRALLSGSFGFDLPEVERMRVPQVPEWD